jgi:hypothetical protein
MQASTSCARSMLPAIEPILLLCTRGGFRNGGGDAVSLVLAIRECRVWTVGTLESTMIRKLPSRVPVAPPVAMAMAALAAASSHLQRTKKGLKGINASWLHAWRNSMWPSCQIFLVTTHVVQLPWSFKKTMAGKAYQQTAELWRNVRAATCKARSRDANMKARTKHNAFKQSPQACRLLHVPCNAILAILAHEQQP